MGSLLFALDLHPLLLKVGHRNPSVFISAYADNCIITGPLTAVQAAVADFERAILLAGLTLNPSDSTMYVPSWKTLSHEEVLAQHHVSEESTGKAQLQITDNIAFPLKLASIKVLSCPVGLPDFCDSLIQSLIGKVENDLSHLRQFPNIHQ